MTRRHAGLRELRKELMPALLAEQNNRCCYCDCELRTDWQPHATLEGKRHPFPNTATIEHLHRLVDGGTSDPGNLVVACFACNTKRGDADPLEYRARQTA